MVVRGSLAHCGDLPRSPPAPDLASAPWAGPLLVVTLLVCATPVEATQLGSDAGLETPLHGRLRGVAGLGVLGLAAWGLSVDRSRVPWRVVGFGLGLQLLFAVFIVAASVMSAPAALVMAKLVFPEKGEPETATALELGVEKPDVNVIDAASRGAADGLRLAMNVGAMLLAFIALIAMINAMVAGALASFTTATIAGMLL